LTAFLAQSIFSRMTATPRDPIQEILGPDASLAGSLKEFEFRPSQVELAHLIEKAIDEKIPAIVEAGTGTGKTIAYLVPVVLSNKKTVISTGTKNLQDQIYFKDIPLLSKAIGKDIDAMLMKGRKNYLCLHRFHQMFSRPSLWGADLGKTRKRIEKWLKQTEFADRGELSWMRDDDPLWDALSCNSDQCLGSECFHWETCYLNLLRQRAGQARIIIVNHHLFFADLMVKKEGFGEIIPRFQVAVFDEAHSVEEIATIYFGMTLSTHQLMEFTLHAERETGELEEKAKKKVKEKLDLIKTGALRLQDMFNEADEKGQLSEEAVRLIEVQTARDIRIGLRFFREESFFDLPAEASFRVLANRAHDLEQRFDEILSLGGDNWLKWYERKKKNVTLHASPLDISESMNELLYQKTKTTVFTSATLSTNGNFDYFRSRIGLRSAVLEGIFPSHFDFQKQTLMYVPKDLPTPSDPSFALAIAGRIAELLRISEGRALVLFTSYHNLNVVHQVLAGQLPYTLFKQGDSPKSVLLDRFREDTHSILLATASFWQGVDVPGEALSCLIIDKLPFDSPGDPLVAARIESIRAKGGNPFVDYQLPSAIIALKQGLGRLIRNSSDQGVLSVLDVRMIAARYGHFFFESLPKIPLTHDLADTRRFFDQTAQRDSKR
jgi:ATP-dependent DNA helicase DinG